ncbi:MAG: hypothetical protein ACI4OR_00665, partial [Alphaproteobacteria bacterium]
MARRCIKLCVGEQGRSILELLGVIALICLLTVGGVYLFDEVVARHEANSVYEDIMTTASSVRTKGAGRKDTKSGIADTRLVYDRTRTRKEISVTTSCPMHAFTIKVNNIKRATCEQLLAKVWKDPFKPMGFYRAEETEFDEVCPENSHSLTTTDGYYMMQGADCANIAEGVFAVAFPLSLKAEDFQYCNASDSSACSACQKCDTRKNICVNKAPTEAGGCPSGQICTRTGKCEQECSSDQYRLPDGSCGPCPPNGICDGNTFACEEGYTLNKEGTKCIPCPEGATCTPDDFTCKPGETYVSEDGESCVPCGPYTVKCPSGKEDERDETTGCWRVKYEDCSGDLPVCSDEGVCICPEGAECAGSTWTCPEGTYKDEAAKECIDCALRPEHTICLPNGRLGCEEGYQLDEDGNACQTACQAGEPCDGCPDERPNWDGEKCVCTNDSCDVNEDCNATTGQCEEKCPPNSGHDVIPGNRLGETTCYCLIGYQVKEGACSAICSGDTEYHTSAGTAQGAQTDLDVCYCPAAKPYWDPVDKACFVCPGGAERATAETAAGEETSTENCYCPAAKPYWDGAAQVCTNEEPLSCVFGEKTVDGCCPLGYAYTSIEDSKRHCCQITCGPSQSLDAGGQSGVCQCVNCTGEGCCPTGSKLCNLKCCDIGAECNTDKDHAGCCTLGQEVVGKFCCPIGVTATTSAGCCAVGEKNVSGYCCSEATVGVAYDPETKQRGCCEGKVISYSYDPNGIYVNGGYSYCCSSDSPGYAYNEKKCCKAGEQLSNGYCCAAGVVATGSGCCAVGEKNVSGYCCSEA